MPDRRGAADPVARGAGPALRRKIELVAPTMRSAGQRLLDHPDVGRAYVRYLQASHGVVRASVPLLQLAASRARERAQTDPVAAELIDYLEWHIVEERGHDEWLLQDLETLGFDRVVSLARPPTPAVASLVGAQYYWVSHYHPVALLGYMAVLEGCPPSPHAIEHLIARTGFDRRAFRTLLEHAELDRGHGEELIELVDRLPLSTDQVQLLGLSALNTVLGVAAVIDEVVEV